MHRQADILGALPEAAVQSCLLVLPAKHVDFLWPKCFQEFQRGGRQRTIRPLIRLSVRPSVRTHARTVVPHCISNGVWTRLARRFLNNSSAAARFSVGSAADAGSSAALLSSFLVLPFSFRQRRTSSDEICGNASQPECDSVGSKHGWSLTKRADPSVLVVTSSSSLPAPGAAPASLRPEDAAD